jgi:hypothetical protein
VCCARCAVPVARGGCRTLSLLYARAIDRSVVRSTGQGSKATGFESRCLSCGPGGRLNASSLSRLPPHLGCGQGGRLGVRVSCPTDCCARGSDLEAFRPASSACSPCASASAGASRRTEPGSTRRVASAFAPSCTATDAPRLRRRSLVLRPRSERVLGGFESPGSRYPISTLIDVPWRAELEVGYVWPSGIRLGSESGDCWHIRRMPGITRVS